MLFAVGAVRGVQRTPHAWLFRTLVRPRLARADRAGGRRPRRGSPRPSASPSRSSAWSRFLAGATVVGLVAVGFALVAALLNAVFAFCLGCEVYLLVRRVIHRLTDPATRPPRPTVHHTKEQPP